MKISLQNWNSEKKKLDFGKNSAKCDEDWLTEMEQLRGGGGSIRSYQKIKVDFENYNCERGKAVLQRTVKPG